MRRLVLIALLAAHLLIMPQPSRAFSAMQATDCDAVWQVVMKGQQASQGVSKDGWCLASNPTGFSFDLLEWRAEGLERVLHGTLPPTALAIRVTDADMVRSLGLEVKADAPVMPMQIVLSLRQNVQDQQLMIENLQISGPKGNMVTLQGVFHDVDFSSVAKMQISLGSAKLRDVTLVGFGNRKLEPYLRPYIGNTFPERSRKRTAMTDKVSDWPDHSFPAATKRAVKQLIATLPAPNGTLRVEIDTGNGLSAALFVQTFLFGSSTKELGERILDSTIFHATWTTAE